MSKKCFLLLLGGWADDLKCYMLTVARKHVKVCKMFALCSVKTLACLPLKSPKDIYISVGFVGQGAALSAGLQAHDRSKRVSIFQSVRV